MSNLGLRLVIVILNLLAARLCLGAPIDLQIGARPQGMGGTFVAVADDISATYWNPAGLTQLKTMEISLMRLQPFEVKDVKVDFAAFGRVIGKWGLGVSFLRQSGELEEGREINKTDIGENAFVFSLSFLATQGVSLGSNIKRLTIKSKKLEGGAGTGYDLALLYKHHSPNKLVKDIKFGLMIRNASCDLKDESVEPSYRAGIATSVYDGLSFAPYGLQAAFDLEKKKEVNKKRNDYQYHLGLEARPHYNVVVRLGNDNGDWTYGLGLLLKNWRLDYAFHQEGEYSLGNSNRISLTMRF